MPSNSTTGHNQGDGADSTSAVAGGSAGVGKRFKKQKFLAEYQDRPITTKVWVPKEEAVDDDLDLGFDLL